MKIKFRQVLKTTCALALLVAVQLVAPVLAAPTVELQQYTALLGSPIVQIPVKDPLLKKAIELLQEHQAKPIEAPKKSKPDSPIGGSRSTDSDKALILGGPDVVPM